jgi:hypothetical protein
LIPGRDEFDGEKKPLCCNLKGKASKLKLN